MDQPPRVFISYSHDSSEHAQRILELANRLREHGIDADIDQYHQTPWQGWPKWSADRIEWANYVLIVWTKGYRKRIDRENSGEAGRGVVWEVQIIISYLYENRGNNQKIILVVFSTQDRQYVLAPLSMTNIYDLSSDKDYEALYRRLTNQREIEKPELGHRPLPPRADKHDAIQAAKKADSEDVQPAAVPSAQLLSRQREARWNPDALRRGSTALIYQLADWAVHMPPEGDNWRQVVFARRVFESTKPVVPSKLLYASAKGTAKWLEMYRTHDYSYYDKSLQFIKSNIDNITRLASERAADPEFDFISLGCGNGMKDICILGAMLSRISPTNSRQFIYYYPLDISSDMLRSATWQLASSVIAEEGKKRRLKLKCILADMAYLNSCKPVYEEYKRNNFFAILGNTIGNEGEDEIISALDESVLPGDFLLVEYNADVKGLLYEKYFRSDVNKARHWDSVVRMDLGAERKELSHRIFKNGDKSNFAERSVMTIAVDANFKGRAAIKELGLALLHSYQKERIAELFTNMGFEEMFHEVNASEGVGLYFGQRIKGPEEALV